MNYFSALVLACVEGITEFLPVSSTAHLTLAARFLGISQSEFVKTFEISIQSGAIFAVILYYRRRLLADRALVKIITAFIPSAVLGLFFYRFIKQSLIGNYQLTLAAMFLGGLVLLFVKAKASQVPLTYPKALFIGLCQTFSLVPGVSRSAAAIVGGLLAGQSQTQAADFAFLLSVPTLLAATTLDLVNSASMLGDVNLPVLLAGFMGSAIAAFISIKFFIRYVQKNSLRVFGIYRIILSTVLYLFWN